MSFLRPGLILILFFGLEHAAKGDAPEKDGQSREKESPPTRTDLSGDPLPKGAIARLGTVRFLHGDWVHSLAFFADGKRLMAACQEEFVRTWDTASGREVRRFGGRITGPMCAALSPDGKVIAAGENGPCIFLWDAATGKELRRLVGTLVGNGTRANSLTWTADSRRLAADVGVNIFIWDPATGQELRRIEADGSIWQVVFSKDGKLLASASDQSIRLWDPATGKEVRRLQDQRFGGSLEFSPDGKILAGSSSEPWGPGVIHTSLRLWDVASGKKLRDLTAGDFNCVTFSPDGKLLAAGDGDIDHQIGLWEPATGKQIWRHTGHEGHVTALAFSRDGKTLASGGQDRRIRLWDPTTGRERRPTQGHSGPVNAIAFAPDGKTVVSGGMDRTIRFWDWINGREGRRIDGVGSHWGVGGLAYAPNGRTMVSLALETQDGEAVFRLWDPASAKLLSRFAQADMEPSAAVAFAPNGETVVAAHWDTIGVWDPRAGKLLRHVGKPAREKMVALALSADGKRVACAREYQDFGLWDMSTGRELHRFKGGYHHPHVVAFSPDGGIVVTAGEGGPDQLWATATGQKLAELGNWTSSSRALAFSPDGRLLAAGAGWSVTLWEVTVRKKAVQYVSLAGAVQALAFSPDGKVLVTAGDDGMLLVWDVTGYLKEGRLQSLTLRPEELEARWQDLAAEDAARAHRAAWCLTAAASQALPFIKKRLQLLPSLSPQRLAHLVADLDDDKFEVRERATKELAQLGELAVPTLRQTLRVTRSAEVRLRAKRLLQQFDKPVPTGEALRSLRAVAVLEHIGTAEAQEVLKTLAKGTPEAQLTQEAKASLERLAKWRAAGP